jgi:pimeloyl-ACP methyl ester carboxylesterase
VAAKIALALPQRVASLLMYEPTLFALLEQEAPGRSAAAGIAGAASAAAAAVARGEFDLAGQGFIDYWMGAGSWAAMPEARRATIAAAMRPIATWSRALMTDPATAADIAAMTMPVALMSGAQTTEAARDVLRVLGRALPHAQASVLPGIGHMGPVTDAELVNARIRSWLLARR